MLRNISFLESLFKVPEASFIMPSWMRMRQRRIVASSAIPISRSKYKPHQDAKECQRRLRQAERQHTQV